jgi:SNF2 family DNA or RNA helicase
MDTRRGWSREQVSRYNRERFEDLVSAGWDLIIVDEAHRLGGSTEQVARYRLGEALAQASPYLLLLSATPHQGKTDAFRRLVAFLDADALPRRRVRHARQRRALRHPHREAPRHRRRWQAALPPRYTQLVPSSGTIAHQEQRALYEAVTEYVREGYNQALREKRPHIGFLMILMQRLVTSSTAPSGRRSSDASRCWSCLPGSSRSSRGRGSEWVELDGQDQMESLLRVGSRGSRTSEPRSSSCSPLPDAAKRSAPDGKAEALLAWIQNLQREENDPALKVLVFTEFVPTQTMLAEFLRQRGYTVACLNGSMDLDGAQVGPAGIRGDAQVLISTDAGGEGLNLQFCHVVVNYDLPWNPMKLEQRIGRVDRIGQKHVVRALNFALEDTVELRVREVLEEKLQRILEEFGVDKLSDVLDSEEGGVDFEQLYVGRPPSLAERPRRRRGDATGRTR